MGSAEWITPLPDGLKIQVYSDVYMVQGEWTVLITIDEPRPPPDFLRLVRQMKDAISSLRGAPAEYMKPYEANWQARLDGIIRECETPRRWWRRQPSLRKRRGLINVVGSAMNYLFGVATGEQVEDLHETIVSLTDNQQRIVNQLDRFTSILNHTYDEIQANRDQINALSEKLQKLAESVHQTFGRLYEQIQLLSSRVNFEVLISQFEVISHRYVRSHEAWLSRKENLELGKLTESLLPPQVLLEILSSAHSDQAYVINPIEWYYEHVVVVPMWLDDLLIYRTKLPLVSAEKWHYVRLWKWSVPVRNYQITVLTPDAVLRDTETGQLDLSPVCYGERPRICRKGLVSPARVYPCVTNLLRESPGYDPECWVNLSQRFAHDVVHHFDDNTYILQTSGTTLTLRCSGRAEQSHLVVSGVYEIAMDYPCSLQGNNWTLSSVFQRTSNVTLGSESVDYNLDLSLGTMLNATLDLDPTAFGLQEMSPVDRRQIKVSDFFVSRSKIPTKRSVWWHSFWFLIIAVLVTVAVVYRRRRYIQQQLAKPAPEIKLKEVAAVASGLPLAPVAAAPDNSAVFQFRAPTEA